jgi:hypothetical protein
MKRAIWIVVFLLMMLPAVKLSAQGCVVCTKTASQLDDKSAKGMNSGILYLAAFPLTIIGTLGLIWWRKNKVEK